MNDLHFLPWLSDLFHEIMETIFELIQNAKNEDILAKEEFKDGSFEAKLVSIAVNQIEWYIQDIEESKLYFNVFASEEYVIFDIQRKTFKAIHLLNTYIDLHDDAQIKETLILRIREKIHPLVEAFLIKEQSYKKKFKYLAYEDLYFNYGKQLSWEVEKTPFILEVAF